MGRCLASSASNEAKASFGVCMHAASTILPGVMTLVQRACMTACCRATHLIECQYSSVWLSPLQLSWCYKLRSQTAIVKITIATSCRRRTRGAMARTTRLRTSACQALPGGKDNNSRDPYRYLALHNALIPQRSSCLGFPFFCCLVECAEPCTLSRWPL